MTKSRKRFRWEMMVAVNDYRNGFTNGFVDAIHISCGDHHLSINGVPIRFRWLEDLKFKLGRRSFEYERYRQWVGNWCWDACNINRSSVREIATFLKHRQWQSEEGTDLLWNWWEKI